MLIDFVSGYVAAAAQGDVDSSVMRQGLYRKFGTVLILFTSGVIDWAETKIPLGFEVPIFFATVTYVVVMELTSILENIVKLNPGLQDALHLFHHPSQGQGGNDE